MDNIAAGMPKTAVVVFVRNEFPDFCSWLAWYFTIGVSTIIVYDDHSTDGTWEATLAASRIMDIRARRSDLSVTPFTARQREAYLGAIREFRDEFEWIGFVDADEYLYITEGGTLPGLLAKHPTAAAVAFSWCIYGSNGHLLKPDAPNIEAFTRHSLPSFGHNRSVKSFVRPEFVVERWRDPHTFDVGGRAYVDPSGRPIHWGGPGAIGHDPDWSVAKLMHYIPRSMEHFIERIRRRSDLQGLTNEYWNVFNMNDVEDRSPLKLLPVFFLKLFNIEMELVKAFVSGITEIGKQREASTATNDGLKGPRVSLVMTAFGTYLGLDRDYNLIHAPIENFTRLNFRTVYLIQLEAHPENAYLALPESTGPIRVRHDHRRSEILPYTVATGKVSDQVSLRTPKSRRYLACTPPSAQNVGETSADRWHANEWECYRLCETTPLGDRFKMTTELATLISLSGSSNAVIELAKDQASPSVLAIAIHMLSAEGRTALQRGNNAPLPSWV